MGEFNIIKKYFTHQLVNRSDVLLGSGDDAALLAVPSDQCLVVSTDTYIADVHFPKDWSDENVAAKSLTSSLSDLAAMGAIPAWVTCALTIEDANESRLKSFASGLFKTAEPYNLQLVGGDLTRGKILSVTMTVYGFVPPNQALRRDAAKVGESIYISGSIGHALASHYKYIPVPQIELGLALRGKSFCAIDISDGLAADLSHMLDASHVGASIHLENIPIDSRLTNHYEEALTAGDDYQLCFTGPANLEVPNHQIFCIGQIESDLGLRCYQADGSLLTLERMGYTHF